MVDGNRTDIDKLGQIVFVGHIVSVPGDHIEGTGVLATLEELASELVYNLPLVVVGHDIFCFWMEKVASISKAVCAQRTKFR